jgi:hypothetical protein
MIKVNHQASSVARGFFSRLLEVVLHADIEGSHSIVTAFLKYLRSIGLTANIERRRQVGGLVFVPMRAPKEKLEEILSFTFLRALRQMPRVKPLDPMIRGLSPGFRVALGNDAAIAPELSAAIFDGGLPKNHGLEKWVTLQDAPGVGAPVANGLRHGLAVTSAFLFGPLVQGAAPAAPYANVDHWRILGADTANDDFELLSVLDRMEDILATRHYDFVNISLGPDSAMDDDDVNAWTSTLDTLLASGETVATVACGNNGDMDSDLGLNRVQPPSDGVNVIAVGACDKADNNWKRAPYSAVGPGRSPGYVKPDFLTFGGSHASPFLVLSNVAPLSGASDMGTSFASPLALRAGTGIRSQFSQPLWAPTVKALMIHHAHPESHSKTEVGWGRLSHDIGDLVLCDDNEAHVIYQRQMPATGAVRLFLPVPTDLRGDVEIKATFCMYCDVDPEDAINYTRAGLDIQFRPDISAIKPPYRKDGKLITPKLPATDTFFQAGDFYTTEYLLRSDAHKWETTFSRTKTKRASSLNQPAFDVSYQSRSHGHLGGRKAGLKFALVLTLRNKHATDLYERVLRVSGNRLQPLRPRAGVQVPVRLPRR